jgi:hypothetical protein
MLQKKTFLYISKRMQDALLYFETKDCDTQNSIGYFSRFPNEFKDADARVHTLLLTHPIALIYLSSRLPLIPATQSARQQAFFLAISSCHTR